MSLSSELTAALISSAGFLLVAFIVTNKTILRWVDSISNSKAPPK